VVKGDEAEAAMRALMAEQEQAQQSLEDQKTDASE